MNFNKRKQNTKNACPTFFKKRKHDKKDVSTHLDCSVFIEKSSFVENLILKQISNTDKKNINFVTGKEDEVSNQMNSRKNEMVLNVVYTMENQKEEKKCFVLPANLPKIQITFKSSGEKTTRIITDREEELKCSSGKDKKVIGRKRPWTRTGCNEIIKVTRITTENFSNAVLGPDRFVKLLDNYPSTSSLLNSPTEISKTKITLSEESQSKVSTPIEISSSKISTPTEISPSKITFSETSQPTDSHLIPSSTFNLAPTNIPNVSTNSFNQSSLTSTQLSPIINKSVEPEIPDQTVFLNPQKTPLNSKTVTIPTDEISKETFKTPFFPKRPPSRLKKKYINDLRNVIQHRRFVGESTSVHNKFSNDNDDVISLYAESIVSTCGINSVSLPRISPPLSENFNKDVGCSKDLINFSINIPKDITKEKSMLPVSTTQVETMSQNEKINEPEITVNPTISDWISRNNITNKNESKSYDDFPKRWCYLYLETGKCTRYNCRYKHTTLDVDFNTISEKNFEIILNGCVKLKCLFKKYFDSLLNYMMENERKDLIIHLVLHVMRCIKNEKMPFIKKIIDTLKNIGFTFTEAINEILLTSGRNNEGLLDILLAFAVEDEDCIKTSWCVIANLINFRRNGLDFGVIQDIFTKCVNDYDKTLAENIYKDIVVKNNFNLNTIDRSILIKYVSLLGEHHKAGAEYIIVNYQINNYELQKLGGTEKEQEQIIEENDEDEIGEEAVEETSPSSDINELDFEEINDLQANNNNFMFSQGGDDSGNCSQKGMHSTILFEQNQNFLQNSSSQLTPTATQPNTNYYYDSFYTENQSPYIPRKRSKTENSSTSSIHAVQTVISPEILVDEDDLTNEHIKSLVLSVRSHDLGSMFSVMSKYSDNEIKIKNVVLHFLAVAKVMDLDTLSNLLTQMFEVFGNHWKSDYQTMNVLKTLGFNLMPRLDEGKKYKTINDILNFFAKDYNSFVKYNYVTYDRKYNTKEMKYIFLFKILCRCKKYKDAYELLKSHESNLLKIFLSKDSEAINPYKLHVFHKCMQSILIDDPIEAKDMVVYLMLNANVEMLPELKTYLNVLITTLLQNYRILKDEVISMFDVILNGWYQHLKPSVLRALVITTRPDVSTKTILKLFNICIEMGVYPDHKGRDNSISIPSNLQKEEISLLVHHQFLQICSSLFPISNIVINVTEPLDMDEYTRIHTIFKGNILTTSDMIRRVLMVLSNIANFPSKNSLDVQNQYIVLPYNSAFLQPYKDAIKTGTIPKIP